MKHATSESLDRIDELLDEIRAFAALKEKTRGVFYLKSQAFLHFHEDDGTMYADVRLKGPDFERVCLKSSRDRRRLVSVIRDRLAAVSPAKRSRV